jgi:glycosyltransferase involved in cell wall biosynthesis
MVDAINQRCVALLVPSNYVVDAMRHSGIKRPIHLVPHGMDDSYNWGDKTAGKPVTFGSMGTITPRKGTDILVRCFEKAFPKGTEDVRLEVKVRGPFPVSSMDPRVVVYRGEWSVEATQAWYHGLTSYVSPTHGEGFGLSIVEALISGCAVIATNWSAMTDYMDVADSYPLDITGLRNMVNEYPTGPNMGDWAVPDEDHLVHLMREIASNPIESRAKGIIASKRIKEKYPLSLPGKRIMEVIEGYS